MAGQIPCRALRSSRNLPQSRAFVHGDVLGLVTLDLVLRFFRASVARMALVLGVPGVDPDDPAAHKPGFRIPANMIADFESFAHRQIARRPRTKDSDDGSDLAEQGESCQPISGPARAASRTEKFHSESS